MSEKKRNTNELLSEMREVAKKHEEMKTVVENMLKEIETLEVKHEILVETIKGNTKK